MTRVNKKTLKTFTLLWKAYDELLTPSGSITYLDKSAKEVMLSSEWFAKEGPGGIKWDIWCDRYTHIATCELKELAQHIVTLHNNSLRKMQ